MVEGSEGCRAQDEDVATLGLYRCLDGSSMWDFHYSRIKGLAVAQIVGFAHT